MARTTVGADLPRSRTAETAETEVRLVGDTLRLGVLGDMTAQCAGEPVDLGGPRQRAVLGLLIRARGDVVPADRLVDELWGDAVPASATSALQAYVSHLRRRLEPARGPRDRQSVISRQGPGYALRVPADAVDAWEFERLLAEAGRAESPAAALALLDQALGLWRGPAYADHIGEAWADAESARLAGLRDVAREQRLDARLQSGQAAVLVPEIEALVAADPLREERWRLLVLALYRSHRQADALAALRRARTTLADELGVDPGPALRALEAEVLAQAPSLDAPSAPPAAPSPAPVPPAAPAAPRTPVPAPAQAAAVVAEAMVERERELATLRSALAESLDGTGRLVLIDGPAGIGKSRLLAEVRRLGAEQGARVLVARGSQLERDFAFGAVRQLFETAVADPAQRDTLLSGAAAAAGSLFSDVPADSATPDGSFAVLHGLYWLTVNLASQQPLVLAVDDLQWCDTGSLRALAFLVRRLEGLPVLVAATLRTGEPHDDESLLAELAEDMATVPVRPEPLGLDGTAQLVRARLGEDSHDVFVAACHRTTGGNPLLLRQLLRALQAEGVRPDVSHADTVNAIGSRAVSSMVLMRLRRLPADATTTAHAIAVLGDGAELPAVSALAGLDEARTAAAIAVLARSEVVRLEHPIGFVHPLVGEAVYQDLSPGERELRHEQAARVLDSLDASAEQVAAQLMLSPRRGSAEVVSKLQQAAATAAGRGAADAAVAYLERALKEPPSPEQRIELLVESGRLSTMSSGQTAVHHLSAAYADVTDPVRRARIAIMLARTMVFVSPPGEATAFARAAAAELPEELVDERQGLLALERISGYMHGLDTAEWRVGTPQVSGTGLGARMLAATLAFEEMTVIGDRLRCAELARFALQDDALIEVDAGLFWVVAAFTLEMAEESIGDFWDRAMTYAYAQGSLFSALSVHLWRGYMLWHHGRLSEALESVQTSNEQSYRWGSPTVAVAYGQAFVVGIMLEQGNVAGARAEIEATLGQQRAGDGARVWLEAHAKVAAAEGRYAEALALLDEAETLQTIVVNPVWRPWRTYRAPVLAALGRADEARALMAEEVALARAWGSPSIVGRTLRVAGELGGPGAEELLREACELLGPSVARYEAARAELALGRVTSDPSERETLLRSAMGGALACGSPGLYREVAAALVADGIDVPLDPVDTVSVTPTERRLGLRAAAGYTYRDIAQEFFLTPASVERTLASLRERVGVTRDRDLAEALASL